MGHGDPRGDSLKERLVNSFSAPRKIVWQSTLCSMSFLERILEMERETWGRDDLLLGDRS